jgi:hypothetical protein
MASSCRLKDPTAGGGGQSVSCSGVFGLEKATDPKRGLSIAVLGNSNGYGPVKVIEYTAALLAQRK